MTESVGNQTPYGVGIFSAGFVTGTPNLLKGPITLAIRTQQFYQIPLRELSFVRVMLEETFRLNRVEISSGVSHFATQLLPEVVFSYSPKPWFRLSYRDALLIGFNRISDERTATEKMSSSVVGRLGGAFEIMPFSQGWLAGLRASVDLFFLFPVYGNTPPAIQVRPQVNWSYLFPKKDKNFLEGGPAVLVRPSCTVDFLGSKTCGLEIFLSGFLRL